MRNKILFTVLLIGVFALGVVSVRAWDHYQVSERIATEYREAEARVQAKNLQEQEQARAAAEAAEKQRLAEVCQSMTKTYEKLTPYQKTITEKPDCNLEQVE